MEDYKQLQAALEQCPAVFGYIFAEQVDEIEFGTLSGAEIQEEVLKFAPERDVFCEAYRGMLWHCYETDIVAYAYLTSALQDCGQFPTLFLFLLLRIHLRVQDIAPEIFAYLQQAGDGVPHDLKQLALYHIRADSSYGLQQPWFALLQPFCHRFCSNVLSTVHSDERSQEPTELYKGAHSDFRAAFLAFLAFADSGDVENSVFAIQEIKHSFLRFAVAVELLLQSGERKVAKSALDLCQRPLLVAATVPNPWISLLFPVQFSAFDPTREVFAELRQMADGEVHVDAHMAVLDLWVPLLGVGLRFGDFL